MSSPSSNIECKASNSSLGSASKSPPKRPSRPSSPAHTLADTMDLFNPAGNASKEKLPGYEFYTEVEAKQFAAKARPMAKTPHADLGDKRSSSSEEKAGFI
ncbi:hypothetical protein IFR05_010311 [Cadophora sp. M221]|nr:hypothetical protein IFR05_010311 [Cadophora sp. M221]